MKGIMNITPLKKKYTVLYNAQSVSSGTQHVVNADLTQFDEIYMDVSYLGLNVVTSVMMLRERFATRNSIDVKEDSIKYFALTAISDSGFTVVDGVDSNWNIYIAGIKYIITQ